MTSQQLFVPCGCLELLSADSINFNRLNPVCCFLAKFHSPRSERKPQLLRGDAQVSYCRHPGPPKFPIYPIICIGSYKEPIFPLNRTYSDIYIRTMKQLCCELTKSQFFISENSIFIIFFFPIKSQHFGRKFLYCPIFWTWTAYFSYQIFQKVAGMPAIGQYFSLSLKIVPTGAFATVNSAQFPSLLANVRRVFGLGCAVGGG